VEGACFGDTRRVGEEEEDLIFRVLAAGEGVKSSDGNASGSRS
jgi:hypothetical protein